MATGKPLDDPGARERTLLAALLLSAWAPLATGYAVAVNRSATQIADFLRRSVELVVLAVAWATYRRLGRNPGLTAGERGRSERRVQVGTGAAMVVSGLVIVVVASLRLGRGPGQPVVWPGLVIASLGLVTNGWFWRRYTYLARHRYDAVIASQARLYAAKTLTDSGVVVALLAGALLGPTGVARGIDLAGSVAVACYLVWSGVRTCGPAWRRSGGRF